MNAASWCKKEKTGKISMIEMANTVVYPRTMVVHFHYTPGTNAPQSLSQKN